MSRPTDGLSGELPGHTVRALRRLDRDALRAQAMRTGQRVVEVDLAGCRDKRDVLGAIARTLALPDWFGMNLDALYDALTDPLDEAAPEGRLIFLDHIPRSGGFDTAQRNALLAVLRDVMARYAEAGIPFRVFWS